MLNILDDPLQAAIADIRRLKTRVEQLESLGRGVACILIDDIELSASAASIDFQNIPQTYKHLNVVGYVRGTEVASTVEFYLRLNNNSGANYDWVRTSLYHSAAQGSNAAVGDAKASISAVVASGAPAGVFTPFELVLPDYLEATTLHSWRSTGFAIASYATTAMYSEIAGGCFRVAGAINRLTFFPTNSLAAGSRITLYGLN